MSLFFLFLYNCEKIKNIKPMYTNKLTTPFTTDFITYFIMPQN